MKAANQRFNVNDTLISPDFPLPMLEDEVAVVVFKGDLGLCSFVQGVRAES